MKHTPGSWKVYDKNRIYTDDSDNTYIGSMDGYYENSKTPGIYNAILVSTAPELLQMLKAVEKLHAAGSDITPIKGELHALIHKAQGDEE